VTRPAQSLVTDAGAVLAAVVTHLEAEGVAVRVLPPGASAEEAAVAAGGVPVVIVGLLPFGAAAIAKLDGTGLLIRAGIGYDIIDVDAASTAGIWVANVPDFCVDEVADHTMLLLAAAMRRLPTALARWRAEGRWNVVPDLLPTMRRMRGCRLGLVGLGRIGRQVAARARSFGWDVVAHDPVFDAATAELDGVPLLGLGELLATSDAVSLHCPLNDATHHLVDAAFLGALRRGAIVVNTSRGGLVDLEALRAAVDSGRVSVAALDVLDGEPEPDLGDPLLHHENVIVTPHVAWCSSEAQDELARNTALEALRYLRGERPRNLVNPDARSSPSAGVGAPV
jgi:phosphoglycerate dehydrogenase-like enzyme